MNTKNIKIRKANNKDIEEIAKLIYYTEVNPVDVWGGEYEEETLDNIKTILTSDVTTYPDVDSNYYLNHPNTEEDYRYKKYRTNKWWHLINLGFIEEKGDDSTNNETQDNETNETNVNNVVDKGSNKKKKKPLQIKPVPTNASRIYAWRNLFVYKIKINSKQRKYNQTS